MLNAHAKHRIIESAHNLSMSKDPHSAAYGRVQKALIEHVIDLADRESSRYPTTEYALEGLASNIDSMLMLIGIYIRVYTEFDEAAVAHMFDQSVSKLKDNTKNAFIEMSVNKQRLKQ